MLGGYLSGHELGATAVTLIVLVCVYLFFRHTRLGLAMRAAAFNATSPGWSACASAGCWRWAGGWRRRSAPWPAAWWRRSCSSIPT